MNNELSILMMETVEKILRKRLFCSLPVFWLPLSSFLRFSKYPFPNVLMVVLLISFSPPVLPKLFFEVVVVAVHLLCFVCFVSVCFGFCFFFSFVPFNFSSSRTYKCDVHLLSNIILFLYYLLFTLLAFVKKNKSSQ